MLNALNALYPFPEIPSLAVQRVYQYALDDDSISGGTTDEAGRLLSHWLGSFARGRFRVATEFLQGPEVGLAERGKIPRHLSAGGVAVLDVHSAESARHSILALRMDPEWIYCWDPRYRTRAIRSTRHAEVLFPVKPEGPNLRVRRTWMEKTLRRPFTLGTRAHRCAILLARRR